MITKQQDQYEMECVPNVFCTTGRNADTYKHSYS